MHYAPSRRTLQLSVEERSAGKPSSERSAQLVLSPRRVLSFQIQMIAVLAIASTLAGTALYFSGWQEETFGFEMVRMFWLDSEHNIPTLYQCVAMFSASVLFAVIGGRYRSRGEPAAPWYVLAFAFAFFAVDEASRVHETVGLAFGTSFGASWTYFYIPVGVALLVYFVPFLRRLPIRIARLFVLSGAMVVGGGVGVEIVGQLYAEAYSKETPIYAALATLEEVLEMLGVAVLNFTLLEHIRTSTFRPSASAP